MMAVRGGDRGGSTADPPLQRSPERVRRVPPPATPTGTLGAVGVGPLAAARTDASPAFVTPPADLRAPGILLEGFQDPASTVEAGRGARVQRILPTIITPDMDTPHLLQRHVRVINSVSCVFVFRHVNQLLGADYYMLLQCLQNVSFELKIICLGVFCWFWYFGCYHKHHLNNVVC